MQMDKLNGSANGHYFDLNSLKENQDHRFDGLERVLKNGFDSVTSELRALREQGYIPVSVVEKMNEQQRAVIHPIIRTLCIALVAIIAWFTGLKGLFPHIYQ